jgi:hypothetical protein
MDVFYRCSDGHLYIANLVKSSLLSMHFDIFGFRIQRCPVDHRWRKAVRVSKSDLTDEQILSAEQYRF